MMLLAPPQLRKTVRREVSSLRAHYNREWINGGSWEPDGFRVIKVYQTAEGRRKFGLDAVRDETIELRSDKSQNRYRVSICYQGGLRLAVESVSFMRE